jgi:hypothetical protein
MVLVLLALSSCSEAPQAADARAETKAVLADEGTFDLRHGDSDAPTVGEVVVTGYYLSGPEGTRLCGALRDWFPPKCGGASIGLELERALIPEGEKADFEAATSWVNYPVEVVGRMEDGILIAEALEPTGP